MDGSYYFVVIILFSAVYRFCCNFVLFVNQFLASEACEASSVFNDLQSTLSTHQGELAVFARELRQVVALLYVLL